MKEKIDEPSARTGSRLRARRALQGVKQADLARSVGISPAYLNLIEHNRRRIGGKLLLDLARALDVDVSSLTQDPHTPLIEGLHDAAARIPAADVEPETDRAEDLAVRFPGWAGLIVQQRDRLAELERRIEALNDRLSHDPFLASSLHEVLSTVTSVRSTAGILNSGDDIDPEWRVRFHRNMYEDSQRLAEGAQALVDYLDTVGKADEAQGAPLDEVETWISMGQASPELGDRGVERDVASKPLLSSPAAQAYAHKWDAYAQADVAALPLEQVEAVMKSHGPDPVRLANECGVTVAQAMRRLAFLPPREDRIPLGMVACDGAGALTYRQALAGFAPPRVGAACPLWPLYQALLRPMVPLRRVITQGGVAPRAYLAVAIAQPLVTPDYGAPEILEATMLFMALDDLRGQSSTLLADAQSAPLEVGTTCRVCAHQSCPARREPSLMTSVV